MGELQNKIAIIGRPNVGKSALFNRIIGRRMAIVDHKPGITRDRLGTQAEWGDKTFTLIDTGGIGIGEEEPLADQVHFQADVAITEATVLLFVVDVMDGIAPLDREVADILRTHAEKVILVVNKCDNPTLATESSLFHELGFETVYPVSAIHGLGTDDLMEEAVSRLPHEEVISEEEFRIKIAVVGKPNAGKSTFINALINENRLVVSTIPGTTRDSIDVEYEDARGDTFLMIDTAGIKRRKSIKQAVDKYSMMRAHESIKRCDVAILMIDAEAGLTTSDSKIAQMVLSEGKSCVIAANKWDIVHGIKQKEYAEEIHEKLRFVKYAPICFLSAAKGDKVDKVMQQAAAVYLESQKKITTPAINKLFQEAIERNQPPIVKKGRLKIFYVTQVSSGPPCFLIFLNNSDFVKQPYLNYLENQIRKRFRFRGAPIKFLLKRRDSMYRR